MTRASSQAPIPYGRQSISDADVQSVMEALRSEWLTQGPMIERFEAALASRVGASHAVAVNSATAALHLAYRALGLGPGDVVWTVPNTFVATANAARYCGAAVDFVDIDPNTYNMDVRALASKLEWAAREGRLPRVVVPVHFAGQSCDMAAIGELAARYAFAVVEDASHAIGGRWEDWPIGACRHSAMTVFSFHPVKIVTTGEGGMVTTNRDEFARTLRRLRSHGITREPAELQAEDPGAWYYEQLELGYNYRLTDLQAALGLSQLTRLERFVARRNELAERYEQRLAGLPLQLPALRPEAYSAWHLYAVRVQGARSRRQVFDALRAAGILVNVHYIPVHTQPYYRGLGFKPGDFPEAERYYDETLSLPLYYDLSEAAQDRVVAALREALA